MVGGKRKDPISTGVLDNGLLYFKEEDILGDKGVSIRRIPAGKVPLLLYPSATKQGIEFTGDPTPIQCRKISGLRQI